MYRSPCSENYFINEEPEDWKLRLGVDPYEELSRAASELSASLHNLGDRRVAAERFRSFVAAFEAKTGTDTTLRR